MIFIDLLFVLYSQIALVLDIIFLYFKLCMYRKYLFNILININIDIYINIDVDIDICIDIDIDISKSDECKIEYMYKNLINEVVMNGDMLNIFCININIYDIFVFIYLMILA